MGGSRDLRRWWPNWRIAGSHLTLYGVSAPSRVVRGDSRGRVLRRWIGRLHRARPLPCDASPRFGSCIAHLRLRVGASMPTTCQATLAWLRDGQRRCVRRSCTRHDQHERRSDAPPATPTPSYVRYTPSNSSERVQHADAGNDASGRHCATQPTTRNSTPWLARPRNVPSDRLRLAKLRGYRSQVAAVDDHARVVEAERRLPDR